MKQSNSNLKDLPKLVPCTVCGYMTVYACSDCKIDTGKSVHVCNRPRCRDAHELNVHGIEAERKQPSVTGI